MLVPRLCQNTEKTPETGEPHTNTSPAACNTTSPLLKFIISLVQYLIFPSSASKTKDLNISLAVRLKSCIKLTTEEINFASYHAQHIFLSAVENKVFITLFKLNAQ